MKRWTRTRRIWTATLGVMVITVGILVSLMVLAGNGDGNFTATAYSDVVRFEAEGVATLQVRIFDLSGKELWDSGVVASRIVDWDRTNEWGERLAYGAYLYQTLGWNADGAVVLQKTGKLALLPGDKVQLQVAPSVLHPREVATPESNDAQVRPMAGGAACGCNEFSGANSDVYVAGKLGIGTTSPARSLHIHNGIFRVTSAQENAYLLQGFTDGGATSNIGVALHADTNSLSPYLWLAVAGTPWGGPTGTMVLASSKNAGTTRDLWIYANDSLTPSAPNILVQANTGRVGIGTANPSATLEVHGSATNLLALYDPVAPNDPKFRVEKDGDVYADGTYYCSDGAFHVGSADVAERINISEWVEEGCVVEIDPEHPGFFRKASSPYSTTVAGIISTSPGVVLGNDFDASADKWEDNRPVLAIAGRVPCKASTENGAIAIGDLLVASSTPGIAMKGDPEGAIGAVVGKAMEPLTEGKGMIMVQVTLR